MKFENSCSIGAPCSALWNYLTDIPKVATCLPGVEEVHALQDGKYAGILSLKIGVIKLRMSGKISIERMDSEQRAATMSVEAADQRISGIVQGKLTMQLHEISPNETTLTVGSDVNLFGKIGEFGHAIIRKKADQMMGEFARNVAVGVGTGQ